MAQAAGKAPWQTEGEEKRSAVREVFARIAPEYDRANRMLSWNLDQRWRKAAVEQAHISAGESALDICTGTGDFLPLLRQQVGSGGRVVGLDFCPPMLELAKPKEPMAELIEGDACDLPFRDGEFDAITMGWGLRNVPDRPAALREAWRVLKPGGRFVCLDMTQQPDNLIGRMRQKGLHLATHMTGKAVDHQQEYDYLLKSVDTFLTLEELADMMRSSGFTEVGHRAIFFHNIGMHWGVRPK